MQLIDLFQEASDYHRSPIEHLRSFEEHGILQYFIQDTDYLINGCIRFICLSGQDPGFILLMPSVLNNKEIIHSEISSILEIPKEQLSGGYVRPLQQNPWFRHSSFASSVAGTNSIKTDQLIHDQKVKVLIPAII